MVVVEVVVVMVVVVVVTLVRKGFLWFAQEQVSSHEPLF